MAASTPRRTGRTPRRARPLLVLLTKLLLAPLCVAGASLAGRRFGPRVAGLVGGLPVVGGPILFVLCLQHDAAFGDDAAAAALAGMLPLTAFVLVYARLAGRLGPWACVVAGWAAFLACVAALSAVRLPVGVALAVVWLAFAAAIALLPHLGDAERAPGPPPAWDIPVRMAAACALVLLISALSSSLGAHVSGLLAPFPIITAVLAGFTHAHTGPTAVIPLMRGFLIGYYAYAAFNATVALALPAWSTGAAFATALAVTAMTQLVVVGALAGLRQLRRRAAGVAAPS